MEYEAPSREVAVSRSFAPFLALAVLACGGGEPAPQDASPAADAPPAAAGGSIGGTITRSAEPAAGGRGHLYVAVFDRDPVSARDEAVAVARTIVMDADMSDPSAAIPYEVGGVPPRAEAYYVTAFLDDNGTVGSDPASAGPDRGDLVALEGLASPSVVVDAERRVPLDLVLNFNLPF